MKKIILLFVLILGITQGVIAQENKDAKDHLMGFAGMIASGTVSEASNLNFGGGLEVGFIKNGFGMGTQVEYFPAPEIYSESSTFARGFLLFGVTESFFIKVAAGIEAKNLGRGEDFQTDQFFNFGVAPVFLFGKRGYFSLQPNLSYSYDALVFTGGSVVMGVLFK